PPAMAQPKKEAWAHPAFPARWTHCLMRCACPTLEDARLQARKDQSRATWRSRELRCNSSRWARLAAMVVIAGVGAVEHAARAPAVATVGVPAALASVERVLAVGDVPVGRIGVALVGVVPRHPLHLVMRATEHGAIAIGAAELAGNLDVV